MKNFNGKVLFLDRNDINTDEIIPAKYLTEISKQSLKPYLLEDIKLDGFSNTKDIAGKNVIITRANFGCGSSREHAPWAIEVNGINLVIAESFARIFRQNMYNCGLLAMELSKQKIDDLFAKYTSKEVFIETNLEQNQFTISDGDSKEEIEFLISDFDKSLILSGGWLNYADSHY
ncbi:MAG: 3-isopropylmalate dehydratase small subunit [Desulfobacterales bacterium]|nr:3-isopropylmalate dehydratase small subunit [Desulfobacterales bacterium]